MGVFRRSKSQRYIVIPLLLTCFLSGCYKWSVQPGSAISDEAPEQVRVTVDDDRVVELRSPEIRGDRGRACQPSRCRTHEIPSTEPFRRAGDVSWRYVPRAADPDHEPTMHLVLVGLAHAAVAASRGELLPHFWN
jgi:hypothetical protein